MVMSIYLDIPRKYFGSQRVMPIYLDNPRKYFVITIAEVNAGRSNADAVNYPLRVYSISMFTRHQINKLRQEIFANFFL